MTPAPPQRDLVDQVRALADAAAPGSPQRRAAGCLVVLLATTKTTAAARRNLDEIPLGDVRQAAAELLDQLTRSPEPSTSKDSP